MNRLTSARTELYEAVAPVLPGRVAATPPAGRAYVAPYIWLAIPEVRLGSAGSATTLSTASFPVWIAYDGAQAAQVAGLDDLIAKVWDASLHVPAARPIGARPTFIDIGGTTVTGVVVTVDVTLGAFTLCLPTVEPSTIPPEPIPVGA